MDNTTYRSMCNKCLRPTKACFCSKVTPFKTNHEFRILMHPKEARYSHVGTGRIANLVLDNCKIIVGENFDENQEVQSLIHSNVFYPMLLYPGDNAINLSRETFPTHCLLNKRPLIFILDGTWPCAKSMMRDSRSLHHLPRISFDPSIESKFSIRHQPAKFCLSTIESIYQVLVELEKQGLEDLKDKKEMLMECLDRLVSFQKKCAEDPSLKRIYRRSNSYKDPSQRISSRKWLDRKICFEDKNYQR